MLLLAAASGGSLTLIGAAASAQVTFTFTRIVDTATEMPRPVPGNPTNFQVFGSPAIDDGRVAFFGGIGGNGHPPEGIYTYKNGNLEVVADWYTAMPGAPFQGDPPAPWRFTDFDNRVSISGNNVAFGGGSPYTPGWGGVYRSTGSGLTRVADGDTPIPNDSGTFYAYAFGRAAISGEKVVFTGINSIFDNPAQGGVYSYEGSREKIADVHTPAPNGSGNFVIRDNGIPGNWAHYGWEGDVDIEGEVVVFGARTPTGRGIFKGIGNSLQTVVDTTTQVPGKDVTFSEDFFHPPVIDDGDVAFIGYDDVGAGVYRSRDGVIETIVDSNTPAPDSGYPLGISDVAMDAGNIAFGAMLNSYPEFGVYTQFGGELAKVLQTNDTLDGKTIGMVGIGPEAISGDQIALLVQFGGGSSGIYLATATTPARAWNVDADGDWSVAANWTGGVPNVVGQAANFGGVIQSPRTVTVGDPITIGRINFDNANSYTIAGAGAITLSSGTAAINVTSGSHAIHAPVVLDKSTTVTVTPAGSTLTLSDLRPSEVTLTKTGAGILQVNKVQANELAVHAGIVRIAPSGGTSRVAALSIAGGAKLDLTDNDLIVDGGDYNAIEALVIQGFNNGDWLGTGITSNAAVSDTNFVTALGIVNNADIGYTEFSGLIDLDGDEILVKYTYYGDADLGGTVNLDDFNQFLFGFNPANAAPQIWLNGDFNYTGAVNLDDFNLFLFGLANQGGTLVSPELFAALGQFVSSEGVDVDLSTVPEPAGMALVMLSAGLMKRRRA